MEQYWCFKWGGHARKCEDFLLGHTVRSTRRACWDELLEDTWIVAAELNDKIKRRRTVREIQRKGGSVVRVLIIERPKKGRGGKK